MTASEQIHAATRRAVPAQPTGTPREYAPVPWYGDHCRLGLHVDFHAGTHDHELGAGADPDVLVAQLERMDVDFVQIDTKGGGGYTSYFAQTPGANVCPVLKGDLVKAWRSATRRLGLPLHAHWIAMGDILACAQHPDWRRVDATGQPDPQRLCYRSPFADEYMIPQLLELVGGWELDGVWIDAEAWSMQPCWCDRCREAYGKAPPDAPGDPDWSDWVMFHRRSFDEYVNRYADALHAKFPNCRICDNWSLTLSQPGRPGLRVDFISSDDAAMYGVENIRLEARFTSTRGLPWDFMQWLFYGARAMHEPTVPQSVRPLEHIQQEAAYILALGGNHQIYENPSPRRDGGLIDWRVDRIAAIHRWCRSRLELCQNTAPWEDVAILNSEHHHARHVTGQNLLWSFDHNALRGAVAATLARHRGVDILDEWALRPRLAKFALLIIPEQSDISPALIAEVKAWVADGGRLCLSGAALPERWGADFLGIAPGDLLGEAVYHVPAGKGRAPVWSKQWRPVTLRGATALGLLSRSDDLQRHVTAHPAATLHRVGAGAVAWLPYDAFAFFERGRYALIREFLGGVLDALGGPRELQITAPLAVEPILRRQGARRIIHLINRSAGWSTGPNDPAVEEIPPVGPVELRLELPARPRTVSAAWEAGKLSWAWDDGFVRIQLNRVLIHEAILIDP